MREYHIYGSTYAIKDDLKAWGCTWVNDKKCWKTPPMEKSERMYVQLKSLAEAAGAHFEPVPQTVSEKQIQEILMKEERY